jgi:hypothetical protein
VKAKLEAAGLRVELDARNEKMNAKIREFTLQKVPFILILGDKEAASDGAVSVRMRLALTEEWPVVFAYDPDRMSNLADCALHPSISLQLLDALHQRWVAMFARLAEREWRERGYTHPETGRCILEQALVVYAWHSVHHLAQIRRCLVETGGE